MHFRWKRRSRCSAGPWPLYSHRARWRTNPSAAFWSVQFSMCPELSLARRLRPRSWRRSIRSCSMGGRFSGRINGNCVMAACNSANSRLFQALRMSLAYLAEAVRGLVAVIYCPTAHIDKTGLLSNDLAGQRASTAPHSGTHQKKTYKKLEFPWAAAT